MLVMTIMWNSVEESDRKWVESTQDRPCRQHLARPNKAKGLDCSSEHYAL
jgi:hypothetical protein